MNDEKDEQGRLRVKEGRQRQKMKKKIERNPKSKYWNPRHRETRNR
jgi:hypothetical protein